MAASVHLGVPVIAAGDIRFPSTPGCRVQLSNHLLGVKRRNLLLNSTRPENSKVSTCKRRAIVQAAYSRDSGRPSSASIFVGGFVLGGLIVGTLGCVFAPQISKALTAADRKDLMRKLPKFIYDEEKALERTRKILAEKIEQLNSAIDDVSSQLRADDKMNGAAVAGDEVEAAI